MPDAVNLIKDVKMSTAAIREQLHSYIDAISEEKLKAFYTVIEPDLAQAGIQYTEAFRRELDRRYENYLAGGKRFTGEEVAQRIDNIRQEYKARQK